MVVYIIYISLYFLRLAKQSQFIPLQNAVYFVTLPLLVRKIFTFYMTDVLLNVQFQGQRVNPSQNPFLIKIVTVQSHLTVKASRLHSDIRQSVGLLWTSDQRVAGKAIGQHTTLTRSRHLCFRQDSNPQFQQASGHRPTP